MWFDGEPQVYTLLCTWTLLDVVSTTATACCTVSATSCRRSYRSFRTRSHEWWREQGSSIISPRLFANFTGCPSANALGSSWRWSSTSVSMGWRHSIWLTTVYWSCLWPADGTWDRRTPGRWSFGEHELLFAPEISLSPALSSGTRYLQIFESRHCLWRRLPNTWKLVCFVARVSASGDCLFCAISMHSLLLARLYTQCRWARLVTVADVCRHLSSSFVTLPAGEPTARRVGGRAADTARRASTVKSRKGDALLFIISELLTMNVHWNVQIWSDFRLHLVEISSYSRKRRHSRWKLSQELKWKTISFLPDYTHTKMAGRKRERYKIEPRISVPFMMDLEYESNIICTNY